VPTEGVTVTLFAFLREENECEWAFAVGLENIFQFLTSLLK